MTGFEKFDNATIRQAVTSKRFLAADRAKLDLDEIGSWDAYLLREHRLLVPIDVQALVVAPGDAEPMVRLPLLLTGTPNSDPATAMPKPFADGTPRPAGVHLHWAMPDALLRGALRQRDDGSANRLSLPVLPDRWVVLRILLPVKATDPVVTGWVLEADRAIAVPLRDWREASAAPAGIIAAGAPINPAELTGTVGGSVNWAGIYDAVLNRFAFHDPLDDLDSVARDGVDQGCVSYTVAGWWSDPDHDPLDAARSTDSLHELLERLRWRLMYEWGDVSGDLAKARTEFDLRKALGLNTTERWSGPRPLPTKGRRAPSANATPFTPIAATVQDSNLVATSVFAKEAITRYTVPPWHLRSSLLHGSVYGVPVGARPGLDRRPAETALRVALGQHDDDVLAALASAPGTSRQQRRATERLLAAFTAQKINRLGSPDGLVEVEENEHSAAFSSIPGGSEGMDRFLQRVQTGGVGGLDIGASRPGTGGSAAQTVNSPPADASGQRHRRPGAQASAGGATDMTIAWQARPTLLKADELLVHEIARSRVGDVLRPTEARVVNRPAARFTFPDEPMVAIRGGGRSLRHGGDGRSSPDGKLTCRWPTQAITEISGVIPPGRFVGSLGTGSIPPEITALAREAVLHDPYHDRWLTNAVAPTTAGRTAIHTRLQAESAVRFGVDGTYDGTTQAFRPEAELRARRRQRNRAAAAAALGGGIRVDQSAITDELMTFSLYRGIDPDLVGVTSWSQPWIPMWLEWEVSVTGVDPPSLAGWELGQIDLVRPETAPDGQADAGSTVVLRGRALLTTGAASTLHDAITDWLAAENARDLVGSGDATEATEATLSTLASAVDQLDVVTASLDGVRLQLLGLPVSDGLFRPATDSAPAQPKPVGPPAMLLAGSVTLTRARLLDAFGRTLEVPVGQVGVPARAEIPAQPNAIGIPPRLLRPARWQFRLVAASTAVGSEGVSARVDQIETALQVSPVAGFLLPDHLDESLEIFAVDGAPLGELLHEPVSGGVTWEISAGRPGPADSGPRFGLTADQAPLGGFAAGLIAADAKARGGRPLDPDGDAESALSALLRAIDTTLWTVDTFAMLGGEHVAGLVGRPIAVVRAQLRLELQPPDDVDLTDPGRAAEWDAAQSEAARHAFSARIGELTRTDDGVLGFFVDDDWAHFRLVDKAIAGMATAGGRSRGHLGLYHQNAGMPGPSPIRHPYVVGTDEADILPVHLGQTVTLTILMHPAGRASLTSGILPRKAVALARDWVGPGLAAIAPSLRTGPVLVETDLDIEGQVRLPKVSVFSADQNFWWRDTPATWRSDAILAATQTAMLPDTPAELREGWIRVAPSPLPPASGATP